ncbi:MAG: branched-chain amino acid ABC transporter permease [Jatrophihabitans sp.]|uniref:branched-chain amino acid ABC transporter permease n=1 Tax=Jatrophihabitans sp. TaxID=1932789 RepID=UPI003F7CF2B3
MRTRDQIEQGIALLLVAGLVIWLIKNLIDGPTEWGNTMVSGLSNGALYALIALGYTLVYGIIELINFAHGDLFMLGTVLTSNMMVNWIGATSPTAGGFAALGLTMIVAMIMCASINMGAEFFAYRRLRSAPKLAPLITAVGLSFVFQNIGQLINGAGQKNWNTVFSNAKGSDIGFNLGGIRIPWSFVVVVSVTTVVLLLLTFIVKGTKQGKAMRATAQDQDGARLMGINVNRTISFTFALGGAMAGVAAVLYMESVGTTRYDAGFRLGLFAFTAAVLGGIGNLTGAVIGGVAIGIIEAQNDVYGFGSDWKNTVVFGILILTLVFKPEGVLGKRTTEKV